MADWATIASLATAGGTLVLAVATFASVRSAQRAARAAERALQAGLRPVLVTSRLQDPPEKINWVDQHWAKVGGGGAVAQAEGGVVYLAIGVRNVGSGIAVLHGWNVASDFLTSDDPHAEPDRFRRQTRDLYVPPGDSGFWQGALRDRDDPDLERVGACVEGRRPFTIEVLYGDHEGGQRTISRFAVLPRDDGDAWLCSVSRHWNLDRRDPR